MYFFLLDILTLKRIRNRLRQYYYSEKEIKKKRVKILKKKFLYHYSTSE